MRVSLDPTFSVCSWDILRLCKNETIAQDVQRLYRDSALRNFKETDFMEVSALHEALLLLPATDVMKANGLTLLGDICYEQHNRGEMNCLDQAICLYKAAIEAIEERHCIESNCGSARSFIPEEHPIQQLNALSVLLMHRFARLGDASDINKAVEHQEQALLLTTQGHLDHANQLASLANTMAWRFSALGGVSDISSAIENGQKAVLLTPDEHPEHAARIDALACSLQSRFKRLGDLSDIDAAIENEQKAVLLTPEGHPAHVSRLQSLANSLISRFDRLGDLSDINSAIENRQKAVLLAPEGHPDHARQLRVLASSLLSRFVRLGDLSDIDSAIENGQKAILLTPAEHPEHTSGLLILANSLLFRFSRLGNLSDIDSAIEKGQKAVLLTPEGHPAHASRLGSLADSLISRFEHLGDLSDIESAIENAQKAVLLTPEEHPDHAQQLHILASSLQSRFDQLGDLSDINSAIENGQKAVLLTPEGHPAHASRLRSLADSLISRFDRLGDLSDINSAIENGQKAVLLTPEEHLEHARQLQVLANSLLSRFIRLGDLSDINSAIENGQKAVLFTPAEHPEHASRLFILASSLLYRFIRLGNLSDINSAIENGQKAVLLTPEELAVRRSHPAHALRLQTLANSLLYRFDRLGDPSDLDSAIEKQQKAVVITPEEHPEHASRLWLLAISLLHQFKQLGDPSDLKNSILHLSLAAQAISGRIGQKFLAASDWQQAALQYSSSLHEVINASAVALNLIPQLIWIGSSIQDRQYALQEVGVVVRDAVALAIQADEFKLAIEWLEQGRSVLWNQILQLRTPMDELQERHPSAAEELQHISSLLEASGSGGMLNSSSNAPEADYHYHELALRREELLKEIRQLPDFERFLLPKQFSKIIPATRMLSGPVVMLNASKVQCDALLLLPQSGEILHVPLPDMSLIDAVRWADHLQSLIMDGAFTVGECDSRLQKDFQRPVPLTRSMGLTPFLREWDQPRDDSRLKAERVPDHGKRLGQEEGLKYLLERLWHCIAKPVLGALSMKESTNPQHIWWCPTGPLAFLPIHAAGIYANGPKLSDIAVSSVIPSIGTLQRMPTENTAKPQLLTVALPLEARLPATRNEVQSIAQHAKDINTVELLESKATKEQVSDAMKHSQWVHLACHGKQNIAKSAESFLSLANGSKLTLTEIIGLNLKNAELAFLSACETATGDKQLEEESVHLAAGMLLAGYRGVIATMWSIEDNLACEIAVETYRLLFEQYNADHRRAADALNFAVKNVSKNREGKGEKVRLFNWVPFVHLGI